MDYEIDKGWGVVTRIDLKIKAWVTLTQLLEISRWTEATCWKHSGVSVIATLLTSPD